MSLKSIVKKAVGLELAWPDYLSQHNAAKRALLEAEENLKAGNELVERLRFAAAATAGEIGSDLRLRIASKDGVVVPLSHYPDSDERSAIRQALKNTIGTGVSKHHSYAQRDTIQAYERHLAELDAREAALEEGRSNVVSLEAAREAAAATLAATESQQPKPTSSALEAVTASWHQAQEAKDRITAKLDITRQVLAQRLAAGSATYQVDELEARLALSDDSQGSSEAELLNAKMEIDLERQEIQRLESRVRGLVDLEASATIEVQQQDIIRRQVGEAVFGAKCAVAEEKVLKKLAELDQALSDLNSDRSQLNKVAHDNEYQVARVKLEGLHLYALEIPEPTLCLAVM